MPEIEYVWDELNDKVIEEYEDGVRGCPMCS